MLFAERLGARLIAALLKALKILLELRGAVGPFGPGSQLDKLLITRQMLVGRTPGHLHQHMKVVAQNAVGHDVHLAECRVFF